MGKLYYDCARYKLQIPDHWNFACALKLMKKLRPGVSNKLETIAQDLKLISGPQTHSALDDSILSWKVTKSVLSSHCGMVLLPLVQYCLSGKIPKPEQPIQNAQIVEKPCFIVPEGDLNQLATFGTRPEPITQPTPLLSVYPSRMTLNELCQQFQPSQPNWFHPGNNHTVSPVFWYPSFLTRLIASERLKLVL